MADVFVSYSSLDRARVGEIVAAIESVGYSVWWDRQIDAGSAFDREIEKAIEDARCIVVAWSENSIESEWVRTEANEGLDRGILVPVAIDPVKPPLAFRRIQTIDFAQPDARAGLIGAIAKLLPSTPGVGLPCVGRARELTRVREQVEVTAKGGGGMLLFSGEAGVGKTRMTLEAGRIAGAKDFTVLHGHCLDTESAPPYQPLLEQLEQIARILGPEAMRRSMGENAPELGKLMPELRQQYGDIPPYPALPPEQERRYLMHGIAEFIARGAAARPVVLVFEDLHWADESTCIMLRYLAERLKDEPVFLIGTYRDGELSPTDPFGRALQELLRERLAEDLRLKRLAPAEITELLTRHYGSEPPASLTALLHTETEGNPFFIEEVLRHLQEEGKLLTPAGKFRDDIEIADTEVSRGVKLIIEDRMARAGPHCREVLTIAAVAGRSFAFDLLAKADTQHSEDDILDAIEEAERKRLIEDISQDRVARYRFVHEQVRQTLLSGLSLPRRQRVHLRVADALEALYPGQPEKYAAEIGHHLYHAGAAADPERTAGHLTLAGDRALVALAFEDALRHFDLALTVLKDQSDTAAAARLQGLRAEALRGAERIPQSLEALSLAVTLAPTPAARDEFILQRCRMLLDLWRGAETIEDLERLAGRAREGADPGHELAVQTVLARCYYVMSLDHAGFADKTKAAYEAVIDLARGMGAKKALGSALVATATLVDYWPEFAGQARANLDEADAIARETADEALSIDVATSRLTGRMAVSGVAISDSERVLERLLALRDPIRLNALYFRMMWATLNEGRLERCLEICDAGVALARRIGTEPVQYPSIKAMALIRLGRFADAWASLEEEVADAAHRFGAAMAELGRFQCELSAGAFEAAMVRAEALIPECQALERAWMLLWISSGLAAATPVFAHDAAVMARLQALIEKTGYAPNPVGQGWLALARGEPAAARAALERKGPGQPGFGVEMVLQADLVLAVAERAEGRPGAARESLEGAVAQARGRQMPLLLSRLLAEMALTETALGLAAAAAASRAEARALMETIAATMPDPAHQSAFLKGPLALSLEIAG